MAMRIYLELKANGADVVGEPDQETVGGEDISKQIEILDFEMAGTVDYNQASGATASERRYKPIRFRKAIDKTTPEIAKAFSQYLPIEATFSFFRTYSKDDGTGGGEEGTVKYYTVKVEAARVVSIRQGGPTPFGEEDSSSFGHPVEDIELSFKQIAWEHLLAQTTHLDSWSRT